MVPRVKTKTIQQRDGGLRASPAECSLEAPKRPSGSSNKHPSNKAWAGGPLTLRRGRPQALQEKLQKHPAVQNVLVSQAYYPRKEAGP